ncbi:MAG: DUF4347 domain-containing protein, partial [Amphritea sp.]|nr:DUF4347 domain-containing protein [Amphritea sp.]
MSKATGQYNNNAMDNVQMPLLEPLEPRIMFAADPLGAVQDADHSVIDSPGAEWDGKQADAFSEKPIELVVIDAGVENAESLRRSLLEQGGQERQLRVFLLDAQRDGIDQISDLLKDFKDIQALHLIAHGRDGAMSLGNAELNQQQLRDYQEQLQGWGDSFSEKGDLLIYGCDLASGLKGQQLVNELSTLTRADVAASDDLTGQAELGGDWELEYRRGEIEAQLALSAELQLAFQGVLADTPGVNDAPAISRFPGPAAIDEDATFSFTGAFTITLTDEDAGSGQLRVSLSTNQGSTLTLGSSAGIIGYSGPAASLTLFGTLNDLNNSLKSLTLKPPSDFNGLETFTILVNDQGNSGADPGNSGDSSSEEDVTELQINVAPVNDPPQRIAGTVNDLTITNDAGLTSLGLGGLNYSPGGGADESGQSLTYRVTSVVSAPLTGNVYLADGTTVVTPGVYSLAQIRGMQFDPLASSVGNPDLLVWTVTDSDGEVLTETIKLKLLNPNNAPVLSGSAGAINYEEQAAAVAIDSGIVLNDTDGQAGSDPASAYTATVTISGNYQAGDTLGFTNTANIQGSLSGNTLTLSVISGQVASVAEFQAALRSVTFSHSSDNPDENTRTVSFKFFDGRDESNTVTKDIAVKGRNDGPGITGSLPSAISVLEDISSPVNLSSVQVADPDAGSGALTLTISTSTGGRLNAVATSGISISNGPGNTQLTLTGTVSALNTYLSNVNNITYAHPTANLNGDGVDQLFIILGDNGNSGSAGLGGSITAFIGTVDVNIAAVDDAAVISGDTAFNGNEGAVVSGDLNASDVDGLSDGSYFSV